MEWRERLGWKLEDRLLLNNVMYVFGLRILRCVNILECGLWNRGCGRNVVEMMKSSVCMWRFLEIRVWRNEIDLRERRDNG